MVNNIKDSFLECDFNKSLCKKCVKQHKNCFFSDFYQKQKHTQTLDTSVFGHVSSLLIVFYFYSMTSQERFELPTDGLAYHYDFRHQQTVVCGLDYIFTISGATRIVSTEPHDNQSQKQIFCS